MALASVTNIEKAYLGKPILRGISFDLQKGQKIGLVGPNGAGKTTLFKILAGLEQPDHGEVVISKNTRWSYVSQQPTLDPDETLRHQVSLVFEELHALERQIHETADLLAHHTSGPEHDAALEKYGHLEEQFQHMGGYEIERRVESILDQLGFAQRDLDLPIKALSGGQKSRAQIARLLLEAPDLMLLDEPTNHLDLPMLDWLENTLNQMPDTTLLVISHDRYFLDSVVNEIFDMQFGQIQQFPGNYSTFTEVKADREHAQQRAFTQQQAVIAKEEEYIRRFGAGVRAMQARGRKTRLNRLKEESLIGRVRNQSDKRVILNLTVAKPSGHDVLKVENLSKSYPDKILWKDINLHITRGKRIGIIGPNGSGKTTLLNALMNEVPVDTGHVKWGHGVVTQFYRQEHQDLNPNNNIIEELQQVKIQAKQQELRDLAALFLFQGDSIEKKLEVLSGGEKARVAIAKLLLKPTNTILMDEPTNHLDLNTCEVVEEALDSFDGTLLLVSHDRYFLDQVCDHLLVLQGHAADGRWKLYPGSYTAYLAAVEKEKQRAVEEQREAEKAQRRAEHARQHAAKQAAKQQAKPKPPAPKTNPKYAKLTVEQIESQIIDMESTIASLELSFANPKVAANPQALKELQGRYDIQKRMLADLTAAWEEKGAK